MKAETHSSCPMADWPCRGAKWVAAACPELASPQAWLHGSWLGICLASVSQLNSTGGSEDTDAAKQKRQELLYPVG